MSPLCLGAMLFGSTTLAPDGSTVANADGGADGMATIRAALDAGINIIDTADCYAAGQSEETVGRAIKGHREEVIVATKAHVAIGDDPNHRGNSRRWLLRACEDSLRRLDTDYIDLYQMHRPDPACDIDETLGALSDLVHAGKIRYIGGSGYPASAIVEAQWAAERRNRERFVCEQPPYSMVVRGIENDVLPTCQRHGLGVLTYAPLAHGWLSGRHRTPDADASSVRSARIREHAATQPHNQRKAAVVDALADLAADVGLPLPQLAVAWCLQHPAVTSVIVGVRHRGQLSALLPAMEVQLDDDVLDRIDAIVAPGTTINPEDSGEQWLYGTPTAPDPSRRRRPRET